MRTSTSWVFSISWNAAVRHKVKKVIFISSGGAIYGDAEEYPTSKSYAPRPLSPYAVSKVASEYYLAFYKHHYALDYTTLRYANIYGPRQVRQGEAGVVAIFMDNLLSGDSSVVNHFPEDPEGMIRDYCYVGDAVRANLLSLGRGSGDFFNIGTGQETKTLTLYRRSNRCLNASKGRAWRPWPRRFEISPGPAISPRAASGLRRRSRSWDGDARRTLTKAFARPWNGELDRALDMTRRRLIFV